MKTELLKSGTLVGFWLVSAGLGRRFLLAALVSAPDSGKAAPFFVSSPFPIGHWPVPFIGRSLKRLLHLLLHKQKTSILSPRRGENRFATQAGLAPGVLLRLLRGGIRPYEGFGVSLVHAEHTKSPQNDGISALAQLEAAKTVFDCFRFMGLAEIGRCRASGPPPQTHHAAHLGPHRKPTKVVY